MTIIQNILELLLIARNARKQGNHPFGALLVDEYGQILLEAGNTTVTTGDTTGHAELNLMREASTRFDREFLGRCTLYTSTEPCPMCAGAIFGRVTLAAVRSLNRDPALGGQRCFRGGSRAYEPRELRNTPGE